MFPKMRRQLQQISNDRAIEILQKCGHAVLSIQDDITGYPYAVPISPVYCDNHIYVHSAPIGHKISALKAHPNVSLCVVDKDEIHPEKLTSYFKSVIVFGTARFVTDPEEKRRILEKLVEKFALDFHAEGRAEAEQKIHYITIIDIAIDHITGKEAIELIER